MTPVLTLGILCRQPVGWTISYVENALIANDGDLSFVIAPIGGVMLLELSKKLYDIGMKRSENH
jgi:hypothetical protein